jgi:hypothetical protein
LCDLPAGLQNLAALQNSTGLNLTGSTGTAATDISQTNLQGLATLANLSVANPSMYPSQTKNIIYSVQYSQQIRKINL